ncbi:MAG: glycosyltransferase, partial [Gemmataceae bacterium]|nr:glycosyltransferase [Gemmataceae bacterium]
MRVSLCMIVRNEEADLPHCLESVVDLVQEIIVVDTGSTDATREVARRYGAKVVDYPWTDSFAAARNESLRHATGDWIFWMDADDRLDADNRERLRRLFASLPEANVAYLMKCVSSRDPHDDRPGLEVDHARLFRNLPGLRWEYRVHEQIMPSLARLGAQAKPCDVVIRHAGYEDAQHSWHKLERNLRLLLLEHAERPDDPVTLFNLGWTCLALGRPQEAASYLRRSLERTPENLNYRPKLYALLARAHLQTQQPAEAL